MQTFLPYPDFTRSAEVLDSKRLGKQRVESFQILRTLVGLSHGWKNHPAVRMWANHEHSLGRYGKAMCREWVRRGFHDECLSRIDDIIGILERSGFADHGMNPWWLGNERLHQTHRASLLMKNPDHYSMFGWKETPEINYWWPCESGRSR